MRESVIQLAGHFKERLGAVRTVPGWKVSTEGDVIWLKGPVENGKAQIALNSLPATANYLADDKNRLFPLGKQTPVLQLKDMQWQSLEDFLTVRQPVSALPGQPPPAIEISLSRSAIPEPATALLTSGEAWEIYLKTAPGVRLKQLKFAVADNGDVIVMGMPLPPLKGQTFWQYKNILLPSGYVFNPPVIADLLDSADILLFYPDGHCTTIPFSIFNQAERDYLL